MARLYAYHIIIVEPRHGVAQSSNIIFEISPQMVKISYKK